MIMRSTTCGTSRRCARTPEAVPVSLLLHRLPAIRTTTRRRGPGNGEEGMAVMSMPRPQDLHDPLRRPRPRTFSAIAGLPREEEALRHSLSTLPGSACPRPRPDIGSVEGRDCGIPPPSPADVPDRHIRKVRMQQCGPSRRRAPWIRNGADLARASASPGSCAETAARRRCRSGRWELVEVFRPLARTIGRTIRGSGSGVDPAPEFGRYGLTECATTGSCRPPVSPADHSTF